MAYAKVGIPQQRVFALKRDGRLSCEQGVAIQCLNSWLGHIDVINNNLD